jgi:glycosyltransferase involved in cell wall biosynthesis
MQGPVTPELLDAAASFGPDLVVFCPYLYWPTVRGVPRFAERAVVHPAAHDEAPLRLAVIDPVFTAARGLAYFSDAERRLVERRFHVGATHAAVVGLGVDGRAGSTDAFRSDAGLGDRPYLLCLGRVDQGKGSMMLARFFRAYKKRHPGDLALVFVGPIGEPLPADSDVFVVGAVDEEAKWGALAGAEVLVSPSPHESFSIVLMEGWACGVPAMVNASCAVTVDHCRASGGGMWFGDYAAFEAALDRMRRDPGLRNRLGQAGRAYVEQRYTWSVVTERYVRFLEIAASGTG